MSSRWSRLISLLAAAAFLLAAALGYTVAEAGGAAIEVHDAWILRAPPVVTMHGGYLTLRNTGTEPRALVAVTSPAYGRVAMHLAQAVDGAATMQPVAQVALPPGETVRFRPGGLHLMLMAPQVSSDQAATVTLHLSFDDDSVIETEAAFRDVAPSREQDLGDHGQHSMGAGS